MSKFIELNCGEEKFIVNTDAISYIEKDSESGSIIHFCYSKPGNVAVLYVDQNLDQVKKLVAE